MSHRPWSPLACLALLQGHPDGLTTRQLERVFGADLRRRLTLLDRRQLVAYSADMGTWTLTPAGLRWLVDRTPAPRSTPGPVAPPTPTGKVQTQPVVPAWPLPGTICDRPRCGKPVSEVGQPYGMCEEHGHAERNRRLAVLDAADCARREAVEAARQRPTGPLTAAPPTTRRRWEVSDPNAAAPLPPTRPVTTPQGPHHD